MCVMLTAPSNSKFLTRTQGAPTSTLDFVPTTMSTLSYTTHKVSSLAKMLTSTLLKVSLKNEAKGRSSKTDFMPSGEYLSLHSSSEQTESKGYILLRICTSVPLAGDRVTETGVEEILKMKRGGGELPSVHCQSYVCQIKACSTCHCCIHEVRFACYFGDSGG